MGTQAQTIPKIETTKEYGRFKLMKGNRVVDYNHVKRLKKEMKANPELLVTSPILVNESFFIIDGQHRRMAAQELNLPIYYIMVGGATLDETRHLNTTQRRWTLMDFARSYADSGREDYKIFLQMHDKYPQVAPSVLRVYLMGGQRNGVSEDFRRGEFIIRDQRAAENNLDRLVQVMRLAPVKLNNPMCHALLQLFNNNKEFDFDLFIKKLDMDSARVLFAPTSSIRGNLRSIENVYNFASKWQKRLF